MSGEALKAFLLDLEGALEQAHADALTVSHAPDDMRPESVDEIDLGLAMASFVGAVAFAAARCRRVCDIYGVDWKATRAQ